MSNRDLRKEIEQFVADSPYGEFVQGVPSSPVYEWGTLAWARLALNLLRDNAHAYDAYQDLAHGGPPR